MGNELSLSDREIMQIDHQERVSKFDKRYQPKQPDNMVSCLNQIATELNLVLMELRRMNDVLDYLSPPNQNEK